MKNDEESVVADERAAPRPGSGRGMIYKGERSRLPDGTEIGKREGSKRGGPALDIWHPCGNYIRVLVAQKDDE